MREIRRPAVAGMFYPDDAQELHLQIGRLLAEAKASGPLPKAIIVPHAGYVYSGPVAASAYARVAAGRDQLERVLLLGPSHRYGFRGIAASSAQAFLTPLGEVPIDRESVREALSLPQAQILDEAHIWEHSLEVHLPFLQEVLAHFRLVPFVVGEAEPPDVSELLELLWGGPETLVVISSDLSHYQDYDTARALDRATTQAIEGLRPQEIHYDSACGRNPVNGLLYLAHRKHLEVETVDLRNSGDTAGGRDRVVGYGAYVFH